jgi:GNAT superfamily N-acetyltransferase
VIELTATAVGQIPSALRLAYLDNLSEPQELFVDQLVSIGQAYSLGISNEVAGYGVVADGSVVEFYVDDRGLVNVAALFSLLLSSSASTGALCKTFDTRMMAAVTSQPASVRTSGFLFRSIRDCEFIEDPAVQQRLAAPADLEAVLTIHDGFFTDRSEVKRYIADQQMYVYVAAGGDLLGCGILTRFVPDRGAIDVGMVVAPAHRRKGIGTYIAAHLKHICLVAGERPICGCSSENEASRRTLEAAGFATSHSLLEFTY